MKKSIIPMVSLWAGILLMGASCVKEKAEEVSRIPGSEIRFSAEAGQVNDDATRTEYSGDVISVGSGKVERLDWVKGVDRFTVAYLHGGTTETADYIVSDVSTSTYRSDADVDKLGDALHWADGSSHTFYAMYPTHSVNSNATLSGKHFQGVLNPTQNQTHTKNVTVDGKTWERRLPDMNYAYMVAYAGTNPSYGISGQSVTLAFRPAVTTFEIRLRRKSGEEGAKVTKVQLISAGHALTGTYSFDITGGRANGRGAEWGSVSVPSRTDANSVITVDFGSTGVTLPADTEDRYLDFTVFAIPQEYKDLSIKIIYANGTSRVLPLKYKSSGDPFTFAPANKYVITNSTVPNEVWTYTLVHTGMTFAVSTYSTDGFTITEAQGVTRNAKTSGITNTVPFESYYSKPGDATKYPVDVTFQYAEGTSERPTGTWSSTTKPTGADNVTIGGTSSDFAMNLTAKVTEYNPSSGSTTTIDLSALRTQRLRSLPAVGSSSAPRDLSLFEVSSAGITQRASGKPTTANCYIVDRPGWYMFPVVYGNAVDYSRASNGLNSSAYTDGTAASNTRYVWHTLQKYDGGLIQSPYILDDAGLTNSDVEAVYVWQDVAAGNAFLTNLAVELKTVSGFPNKSQVPFIKFEIPRATICQGNAVVAVRKKSDKTILWSWHIWVTDGYDADQDGQGDGFGTVKVITRSSSVKSYNDFFPMSLGWCDAGTAQVYDNRYWWVKVIQKDVTNSRITNEIIFRVTQQAPPQSTEALSSGTFYQWGRKDPFLPSLPGTGTTSAFKPSHSQNDEYTIVTNSNTVNYTQNVGENASLSIQNPYVFYLRQVESGYQMWMKDQYPANLWNINGVVDTDQLIVKTVYDPCPPGFCLPHKQAYTWFTTTGGRSNSYPQFNVVDKDGGGISSADYDSGISPGWIYFTGIGDGTIHFPAVGYIDQRLGSAAGLVNVDSVWGRYTDYWTGAAAGSGHHGYSCAYRLHADHLTIGPSDADAWSTGFAVRPVKED